MIRRPPRSTLFPTRRSSDLYLPRAAALAAILVTPALTSAPVQPSTYTYRGTVHTVQPRAGLLERSEEHTSELQSRLHLVCRLLLEKKKEYARVYFLRRSHHT